jgi:hypothetical protein
MAKMVAEAFYKVPNTCQWITCARQQQQQQGRAQRAATSVLSSCYTFSLCLPLCCFDEFNLTAPIQRWPLLTYCTRHETQLRWDV